MAQSGSSDILLYRDASGRVRVEVHLQEETFWLTANQIAEVFETTPQNIGQHIHNVFEEGELEENACTLLLTMPRLEGDRTVRRTITHYNLDLVISVGYRISSKKATRFRQWATERLREYLVKGFTMDDERLKNPGAYGEHYFQELLQRILDIRASEKRAYQQIKDIYKLAADYDASDAATNRFYAKMQNLMHYAITGMTAAEIVKSRANREKANMGLTSWEGSQVRRKDVATAKNYLNEEELDGLNRIVTMFLDFAENRARRRQLTYMADWEERLVGFLEFNEMDILQGSGKVSAEVARALAYEEYDAFESNRRHEEAISADLEDLAAVAETIASKPEQDPA